MPARGGSRRGPASVRRIRINVSGHNFEVPVRLLDRHPDTLLGNARRRAAFYDRTRDELFLDRHRPSFEAIFSYYQLGGRLRRPHHVPDDIFLAEVEFYELERDVVDEYKMSEGYTTDEMQLPSNATLKQIWMHFEYPETSRTAYIIAVVSVVVTLVSIILFCIETLPSFAMTHCVGDEAPNFLDLFFIIETVCTAWFTIDFDAHSHRHLTLLPEALDLSIFSVCGMNIFYTVQKDGFGPQVTLFFEEKRRRTLRH